MLSCQKLYFCPFHSHLSFSNVGHSVLNSSKTVKMEYCKSFLRAQTKGIVPNMAESNFKRNARGNDFIWCTSIATIFIGHSNVHRLFKQRRMCKSAGYDLYVTHLDDSKRPASGSKGGRYWSFLVIDASTVPVFLCLNFSALIYSWQGFAKHVLQVTLRFQAQKITDGGSSLSSDVGQDATLESTANHLFLGLTVFKQFYNVLCTFIFNAIDKRLLRRKKNQDHFNHAVRVAEECFFFDDHFFRPSGSWILWLRPTDPGTRRESRGRSSKLRKKRNRTAVRLACCTPRAVHSD